MRYHKNAINYIYLVTKNVNPVRKLFHCEYHYSKYIYCQWKILWMLFSKLLHTEISIFVVEKTFVIYKPITNKQLSSYLHLTQQPANNIRAAGRCHLPLHLVACYCFFTYLNSFMNFGIQVRRNLDIRVRESGNQ